MAGRLRYTEPTFTLPVNSAKLDDLEWALRVGTISQEEYDRQRESKSELTVDI